MPHRRADVVAHAVELLDTHGLAALTMRRLGAELDVQPSAIYHHFENKQALLAAVADEILARGARPRTATGWPDQLREICSELRHAMLACTDGADVVATVWAFGLGAAAPVADLEKVLTDADVPDELVVVASRTLVPAVLRVLRKMKRCLWDAITGTTLSVGRTPAAQRSRARSPSISRSRPRPKSGSDSSERSTAPRLTACRAVCSSKQWPKT